jgi:hypothetical protein
LGVPTRKFSCIGVCKWTYYMAIEGQM